MSEKNITFYDSHKPKLKDGVYTIDVNQTVSMYDYTLKDEKSIPKITKTLNFHVNGPRFILDKSLIESVYPPVGGMGDFMSVLPSITLNRSTLPWERTADLTGKDAPWLFLLLIDEKELEQQEHIGAAVKENNGAPLSDIDLNRIKDKEEIARLPKFINYLEVDKSLTSLFPTLEELKYLSYAQKKHDKSISTGEITEEKAVVLCNRLPQKGNNSSVYLVSLENNYCNGDFKGNTKGDKYILPYLYKWDFHTFDDQLICLTDTVVKNLKALDIPDLSAIYNQVFLNIEKFKAVLNNFGVSDDKVVESLEKASKLKYRITSEINDKIIQLSNKRVDLKSLIGKTWGDKKTFLKSLEAAIHNEQRFNSFVKSIETLAKLPGSTFHELLAHLSGGFKPLNLDPVANKLSSSGAVKLPFHKIEKEEDGSFPFYTSAYYRSPFAASEIQEIDDQFPLNRDGTIPFNASKLLLSDDLGKEDTTYAAAYELGKLTALNDVDFSTEFYKWKNETAMAQRITYLKSIGGYKNILHLTLTDTPRTNDIPKHVLDRFNSWKQLKGIPYRYLVPNPKLLPNESIRFFQVDNNWINSFICGAFSIGHTVEADLTDKLTNLFQTETITGFLVNSLVVKAWPDFEVDVFPVDKAKKLRNPLKLIRKDNLDAGIQLRLHEGLAQQLNFHLHPGKMHSGFLFEEGNYLKEKKGALKDSENNIPKDHIFAQVKDNRVVNIAALKTKLEAISISDFAAKMIQGNPAVSFTIE